MSDVLEDIISVNEYESNDSDNETRIIARQLPCESHSGSVESDKCAIMIFLI